jgi:hypothetical protein
VLFCVLLLLLLLLAALLRTALARSAVALTVRSKYATHTFLLLLLFLFSPPTRGVICLSAVLAAAPVVAMI